MQNQNQRRSQGSQSKSSSAKRGSSVAENALAKKETSAVKSIGAVIGESLAKDAQERVDQVMDQVNDYFETAKEYVTENPKEAAAVAACLGLSAWVLLYTKPGRLVFEKGSATLVPQISRWISQTFASNTSSNH